jgi:hypothetical protein
MIASKIYARFDVRERANRGFRVQYKKIMVGLARIILIDDRELRPVPAIFCVS